MHIYLASDHAGFELKNILADFLRGEGHSVEDMGPRALNPTDDYPDFILPLARHVAEEPGSFGVVLGRTGEGEAMAANRITGVRAALYYGGTEELLRFSREHNNANVLSLGAEFMTQKEAEDSVRLFLGTRFSGEERHVRRIKELDDL